MSDSLKTVSQSVTIVTKEELAQQTTISQTRNLGEVLPKLVPGLALSNQSTDNFGQGIRGRNTLVMIDGVPQYSSINIGRDLNTIDPASIERIEVIRGATAIYGKGASGGLINIITKKAVKGTLTLNTNVTGNMSLAHPDDSFGGSLTQGVTGGSGPIDYTVTGTFSRTGGQFDADGDRTMPGYQNYTGALADTNVFNIHGKVGYDIDQQQRIQLSTNYHDVETDTDYTFDQNVDDTCSPFTGCRTKARLLEGLSLEDEPHQKNLVTSLDYTHQDLWGSQLTAQGYYRRVRALFPPFNLSAFSSPGLTWPIQAGRTESDVYGGRLQIVTPIPVAWNPRLLYGVDYNNEETSSTTDVFDTPAYNASGGRVFQFMREARGMSGRQQDLGFFLQTEVSPLEWVTFRGGFRHERIWINASDSYFPTTPESQFGSATDTSLDATLFNAGVTAQVSDAVSMFFNYSEGFILPQWTSLRVTTEDQRFVPIKTENYELGARGDWERVQGSLAVFYNKSELGASFDAVENTLVRAPERRWGLEFTADATPIDNWQVGTTVSYLLGVNDTDGDGSFTPMATSVIPPVKVTGYVEHLTCPDLSWRNRVQILYSGSRDLAFDAGVEQFPIESFVTVDLISSIQAGPGTLRFGVENVLNELYFAPQTQSDSFTNRSYTPSRGATATIGYSITY
ncbi:MAG: TonB-dependent receptor [Candidatus Nitronauta litoralis]|uniref:TonB-dependent receptor n=1 Tax=Candidatus Nitronauta litoralis TaxID=2705533 RepID=A0A7T0G1X2_9BACT|nr:MAG: TonB-dependent receptor [Candidatus Nitronauta litoralis]